MFTCRTKDEKLECLKYLGSISLVKATASITANPISSLSQHMIFLFSGCLVLGGVPREFSRFLEGRRLWCRCYGRWNCGVDVIAASLGGELIFIEICL